MPEITPQVFTESSGVQHTGEKIVDDMDRGETGWIDWTGDYESWNNVRTARLFKVRELGDRSGRNTVRNSDFNVDEEFEGQGVGRELLTATIDRVKEHSYQQLLILGAHQNGKAFYEAVLTKLKQANRIKGFQFYEAKEQDYKSWHFRINL